jgi:hypothetical protein
MTESDSVDGRHKAGHDGGGRSINSNRYKSPIFLKPASPPADRAFAPGTPSDLMNRIAYQAFSG